MCGNMFKVETTRRVVSTDVSIYLVSIAFKIQNVGIKPTLIIENVAADFTSA